ncbi:MAG: flagellar biosynthesis regulator FlaF [Pseudomonadota bacterium]
MDPNTRAAVAYGDAASAAKSPRQVEYQAFARITKALANGATPGGASHAPLKAVADNEDRAAKSRRFTVLANALHENLRLWTIMQGDITADGNGLPDQLRAQLFYLAEFTRDHTRKVLRGEAQADALIEINTAVMRGLRAEREPERCPA